MTRRPDTITLDKRTEDLFTQNRTNPVPRVQLPYINEVVEVKTHRSEEAARRRAEIEREAVK